MKFLSSNHFLITLGLLAFVVLGINLSGTMAQNGEIDDLENKMNQLVDIMLMENVAPT